MLIHSPTARSGRCVCTCGLCVVRIDKYRSRTVVVQSHERLVLALPLLHWHSELRSIRPSMSESVVAKSEKKGEENPSASDGIFESNSHWNSERAYQEP